MKNEMNKLAGLRHAGLTMKGKTFLVLVGAITLSFGLAHGITPELLLLLPGSRPLLKRKSKRSNWNATKRCSNMTLPRWIE